MEKYYYRFEVVVGMEIKGKALRQEDYSLSMQLQPTVYL